jgi:hypothetical protein
LSVQGAHVTLTRAASFWRDRADRLDHWNEPASAVQARYTANCFRELDGFLRTLLEAVAPDTGPAQRNTANKLGALTLARGTPPADAVRLRAIGRSTACLFHCAGWVRRPDVAAGTWMTAGWPERDGQRLRRYPLGDRLRPRSRDVIDVCGFFLRVGEAVAA